MENLENKEEKIDLSLEDLQAEAYKLSDKMLQDLQQCLRDDFTIEETCLVCGITTPTYYEWLNKSSEFKQKMELAKAYVGIEAKKILARAVIDDPSAEVALKYLERRQKKIYASRTEITGEDGDPLNSGTETALVSIADSLNKILDNEIPSTNTGGGEADSTPPIQE